MPFTIPGASGAYLSQRAPGKTDFDILAAGYARTGVRTGCAVTAQATPNMTTAVAGGTIEVAGAVVLVTGGNVTHVAADATNPRRDLVVVNGSGVKSVVAGVAAVAPVLPALPAASVALAAVEVPATATAVTAPMITDKRVVLKAPPPMINVYANQGSASGSSTFGAFGVGTSWQLPDAALTGVNLTVAAPAGTTGLRAVKGIFAPIAPETAKVVTIIANGEWAAIGEVYNAHTDTVTVNANVPATNLQMFEVNLTAGFDAAPIVGGSWVGCQVQRSGAAAADTFTAAMNLLAVVFEWEM
jgi:hypothetical protein